MDEQCVVTVIYYIYTLSVCKERIQWSINGTGIIGMGWNFLFFF